MIQIKKNNYIQPAEVRENVVQAICEAFIAQYVRCKGCNQVYHPFSEGAYRRAARFVARNKEYDGQNHYKVDGLYDRFENHLDDSEEGMIFTGAEMKRAFEELIKAGYYMFRIWEYGFWMGYICSDKPFYHHKYGAEEVYVFSDRID